MMFRESHFGSGKTLHGGPYLVSISFSGTGAGFGFGGAGFAGMAASDLEEVALFGSGSLVTGFACVVTGEAVACGDFTGGGDG
jgi:hypothetical protein